VAASHVMRAEMICEGTAESRVGHVQVEREQGDCDRDHAVGECLDTTLGHPGPLANKVRLGRLAMLTFIPPAT
jgi:hypothetical protein